MTAKVISLQIKPGIQRDGTLFDAPSYVDGRWVRFQRGRPRKMQGYKGIFLNASGISRGMIMNSENGLNYIYSGTNDALQMWQTDDDDGIGAGPFDITLSDFTASDNNLWQFDIGYDVGGGASYLIAHPGQNLMHIDSTVNTPVLYGDFPGGAMAKLTDTQGTSPSGDPIEVSGGCVMLHPYLFVYGNNGLIKNSSAGNFFDWNSADANETNVATGKIVKGLPVRGGTTSPSGLFWSTDSLVRVSYTPTTVSGSTLYWRYDIISSQSSILSSSCVIEYDGIYFWIGVDRFLMYNGVVTEIPNSMNFNYFFDNLNYAQRQKVWASKVPRWGEIWWFFPNGDSTECNDAVVFNVREQVWYDAGTAIGARRSAGVFTEVFRKPVWAGTEATDTGYVLWQHETGTDEVYLNNVNAIQSYYETNNIGWVTGGPGADDPTGPNRWIRVERIEPDFNQVGDMNVYITGKSYAQDAADTVSDPYVFSPDTPKIDMREQRREMRIKFESNTANGYYEAGQILLSADFGDERGTGNP